MKNSSSKFIWGILFVLFGMILAMKQFGFLENFTFFFPGWWTLFFIVPNFVGMLSSKRSKAHFIWFSIGTLLALYMNGFLGYQELWNLVLASICIVIGLSFIFRNREKEIQKIIEEREKREHDYRSKMTEASEWEEDFIEQGETSKEEPTTFESTNHGSDKQVSAYLSSTQVRYMNEIFQKANITTILGNVQLDLRNAIFEGDGVLEVSCILAGIDIFVPSTINVVNHCNGILSGVDYHGIKGRNNLNQYTLHIKGTCILGGIDIK